MRKACPKCQSEDTTRPSMKMYQAPETNYYQCFKCQHVIPTDQKMPEKQPKEIMDVGWEHLTFDPALLNREDRAWYRGTWLATVDNDTLEVNHGWRVYRGSLLIPFQQANTWYNNFVLRHYKGTKWRTFSRDRFIMNYYDRRTEDIVFIVEDSLSAIWLWLNGYAAVSCQGTNFTWDSKWIGELMKYKRILVWFDPDDEGLKATERFCRTATDYGVSQYVRVIASDEPKRTSVDDIHAIVSLHTKEQ